MTNSSGTIESVGDVVVLDKPSPPKGPLVPEEIRADHVKVKWQKPEDTGGSDITGYVLEKMDMDTGRWIPAGECGPDDDTFTFKGLTPNKKYKFRVRAKNKEGESEPLETTDAILARNPYDEPSKPGKPDIVDYDNVSATLNWAKPEKDGGRPITHYTVEMKSKFSPEWAEVLKTPDDKCEAVIDGLKENLTYQFRVKAHNKAGPSEASEPTDNHLCKYKNCKFINHIYLLVLNVFSNMKRKNPLMYVRVHSEMDLLCVFFLRFFSIPIFVANNFMCSMFSLVK